MRAASARQTRTASRSGVGHSSAVASRSINWSVGGPSTACLCEDSTDAPTHFITVRRYLTARLSAGKQFFGYFYGMRVAFSRRFRQLYPFDAHMPRENQLSFDPRPGVLPPLSRSLHPPTTKQDFSPQLRAPLCFIPSRPFPTPFLPPPPPFPLPLSPSPPWLRASLHLVPSYAPTLSTKIRHAQKSSTIIISRRCFYRLACVKAHSETGLRTNRYPAFRFGL